MKRIKYFFLAILLLFANLVQAQEQLIDVQANSSQGLLTTWEIVEDSWRQVFEPMPVMLGKNGIAPVDEKREGDGRTPSGMFKLRRAFGYLPSIQTGLSYAPVTSDDIWIDDPKSAQYNQWIKETSDAKSFEKLRREDDLYKYAIVIEYNTDPIISGNGSAIFLHIWRDDKTSTAGCVALSEENVLKILNWLDSKKAPAIVLTKEEK